MIVQKIYHQGYEVKKILDSYGNIVFQKTAEMTNDIKFHTKSSVNSVNYFTVYYTDSTQKDMKYSEPNKEYVFPIPTDKTVRMINFGTSNIDEVTVSCKIKLSSDLFNSKPSTIRLLSCDSTESTNLINSFKLMVSPQKLVEIRNLDARNATGMTSLFTDSYGIQKIIMRDLNVSKVTDMSYMFADCSGATTIDIANWDTSSLTQMDNMFVRCKNVTDLDLSSLNTNAVTSMYGVFDSCEKLAYIKLNGWNTSKVTSMGYMFYRCSSLTSLDLSGWYLKNTTNIYNMFRYCNKLNTIKMIGCNQTTIDKIKNALSSAGILNQVTIIT